MAPNKQIGWSQEASLLQVVSKQLESLSGLLAQIGGGGGSTGSLKTLGDVPITSTLVRIVDGSNNVSGLYLSTEGVTCYSGTPPANQNTAFGTNTILNLNDSSVQNVAVGDNSLKDIVSGSYNTAIGVDALKVYNDLSATIYERGQNTAIGNGALFSLTTGAYNAAVGAAAGLNSTTVDYCTFIGNGAGYSVTGNYNTGIGALALWGRIAPMTGSTNLALGFQAGRAVTSGSNNILLGSEFNDGVTSGNKNILINPNGNSGIHTGSNNVVIGGAVVSEGSDRVIFATGAGTIRLQFDSVGQMTLTTTPTQGTGATTEKMLVRDTAAGAIKVVEYVVTNATASVLSAATLNTTYPNATLGFRVICMNIAGGALVYTKIGASTWGQQGITTTA